MISHDFKLIFVHIPKCAGRSVCDLFNQRFDHYTANYFANEFRQFWNEYNKFTIVRNPYDRLLSLYEYAKVHRRHKNERIMIAPDAMEFNHWLKINLENFQGSFNLGSAEGERGTDGDLGSCFWFSSQARRLTVKAMEPNRYRIDPVTNIKIFRLEDGMEPVERYLANITGVHAKLPHSNKSDIPDRKRAYNNQTRALAESFGPIQEDCAAFGYTF